MEPERSWESLRAFLAVARGGTLDTAGRELGVHPSTVHRRVAALEESLSAQLFDKAPRGYLLTAVGEAMVPHAVAMEEASLAAARAVFGHDRLASGPLRVAMPDTLVPVVAPHLDALRSSCPKLVPVLVVGSQEVTLGREADVALRAALTPPESVIGRRLCSVAWGRYARRGVPDDVPWVAYEGMDGVAPVAWRRRTFPDAEVVLRVDGVGPMAATLPLVAAQGMLPCFVGDALPALRRVGEPVRDGMGALWLLLPTAMRRNARVRAFADELVPRLMADMWRFEGGREE